MKSTVYKKHAWPLRLVAGILVSVQTVMAVGVQQAIVTALTAPPKATEPVSESSPSTEWQPPAPRKASVIRTSNDTIPSAREQLAGAPSDRQIMDVRLFPESLLPTGSTTATENRALALALTSFSERRRPADASSLRTFLTQYPQSAWRPALLTALGNFYAQNGGYSDAITVLENAWEETRQTSGVAGSQIANQALINLIDLDARFGRQQDLASLLTAAKNRNIGPGLHALLSQAQEALAEMQKTPETAFLCGPVALAQIRSAIGLTAPPALLEQVRATKNGFNLTDLAALAHNVKMDYQMAKRSAGAPVVVPSVVHLKVGHYAAILRQSGDRYQVQDPAMNKTLWVDSALLDEEGSGYYLIPGSTMPVGWQSVTDAEGRLIWGKGVVDGGDKTRLSANDVKCGGGCPTKTPMAFYAIHAMLISLNVNDTPIAYSPPRGPSIDFTITYNQQEDQQTFTSFPYSNVGRLWTFNWLSYVQETGTNVDVSVYLPGGGEENYTYDPVSNLFQLQPNSLCQLIKNGSSTNATYERRFPDGSKQIYAQLDGSVSGFSVRHIYLSQIQDVQSNVVTLVYDNATQHRLTNIVDALGQSTVLAYYSDTYGSGTNANFYKIKTVTDPWGRKATFTYNTVAGVDANQLASSTDPGGLVSQYTYSADGSGFMIALGTPYGTTTFTTAFDPGTLQRWIQATDPLGQTERAEFNQYAYTNGVNETVPTDFVGNKPYYGYRNSFFWDKNTMAQMGNVISQNSYNLATIYHWLHVGNAPTPTSSGILESIKKPLESRVCYEYPGQSSFIYDTTNTQPSVAERILDDGTTQTNQYQYNTLGAVTRFTDPLGRVTRYNYSTNNIDLLEIRQGPDTDQELLATYSYDPLHPHLAKTLTDASGRITQFTYNAFGQLLTITNALGQGTVFAYDTNGYLQSVTSAVPSATFSLTYDNAGRVQTITSSTGYTISCDYDRFDRITKVHYPDGTFEQTTYKFLNTQKTRDRLGRWTDYFVDPLQHVVATRDAFGRTTQFQWCGCGALEALIDPLNRVTIWNRDIEGRVTSKVYPDGRTDLYQYETNSSRLKSFTDALNSPVRYSYYADNSIKEIQRTNVTAANPSIQITYDSIYSRVSTIATVEYANASYVYNYNNVPTNVPTPTSGNGMLASISASLFGNNYGIGYAYDELGRAIGHAIDGVNSKAVYDALGRVVITTNILGSFTNNYFGATPRLSSVNYPNGQTTLFTYFGTNGDEHLSEIFNQNAGGATLSKFDYTYDSNGQIQTWTQQADAAAPQIYNYEYDRAGQLMSAVLKTTGANPVVLKQFAYLYDTAGNRTSEQVGVSSSLTTSLNSSSFNNLNQLTSQGPGGTMQVKGTLNVFSPVTINQSAGAVSADNSFTGYATNVVASVSGTSNSVSVSAAYATGRVTNNYGVIVTANTNRTFAYDMAGNLLADGSGKTFSWENGNLISITNGLHVTKFLYDGLGRRISTQEWDSGILSSQTYQIWSGSGLCEERSASFTVNKRFFGGGEQISGTKYYFTRDHLGSVREMTDSSGTIQARYDYDPYGRQTKISGSLDADFGYTGIYRHAASGLNLALFRAYDPDLGRWLSRDPVAEKAGINLYDYVLNDPLNNTDPDGRFGIAGAIFGAITGAVGGAITAYVESGGNWGKAALGAVVGGVVGGVVGVLAPEFSNEAGEAAVSGLASLLKVAVPAASDATITGLNMAVTGATGVVASAAGQTVSGIVAEGQSLKCALNNVNWMQAIAAGSVGIFQPLLDAAIVGNLTAANVMSSQQQILTGISGALGGALGAGAELSSEAATGPEELERKQFLGNE